MKNKKSFFKILGKFLVLILVLGFFAGDIMELTYSAMTGSEPDVIVTVDSNGGFSQRGNLFENQLWYPGMEKEGIIRIHNQYKSIKGGNLGVGVELIKVREDYNWDRVKDSFLQHMKLTITKGKLAIFEEVIFKDKSLGELLSISNNHNQKDTANQFSVSKNDFIDLKYKLLMDEEASNELQRVSANISLTINLKESLIDDGNTGDSGGSDKDKEDEETIEILDDLIPLGTLHWAHDCIITLLKHGIIRGYPDGSIRRDQPITRAEAFTIICKLLGLHDEHR